MESGLEKGGVWGNPGCIGARGVSSGGTQAAHPVHLLPRRVHLLDELLVFSGSTCFRFCLHWKGREPSPCAFQGMEVGEGYVSQSSDGHTFECNPGGAFNHHSLICEPCSTYDIKPASVQFAISLHSSIQLLSHHRAKGHI